MARLGYVPICTLLGIFFACLPPLVHGPIPEKFDQFFIAGSFAVWAWYLSRAAIGLLVGITIRPRRFWLRGLLVGAGAMFPLGFVSLAVPTCGPSCMGANLATGALIGLFVACGAYLLTGLERAPD